MAELGGNVNDVCIWLVILHACKTPREFGGYVIKPMLLHHHRHKSAFLA